MRFKVEILINKDVTPVTHIFHANNVTELDELIKKKFPKGRVLSIIGGGTE